jgi:uncharacterized membrane protein (DUF485 family)
MPPYHPYILIIRFIEFLTTTEVGFAGERKSELSATERITRKLVETKAINAYSSEVVAFKAHYKKYISLSNRLSWQIAITVLLIFCSFILAALFYMHNLTYLLYQQGIRRGSQVAYTDSYVGSHEFVLGAVFLLLGGYLVWKIFIEEFLHIYNLKKKEDRIQEFDEDSKTLESAEKRLAKTLIALAFLAIFLAFWGTWTALSTYPSLPGRTSVLAGIIGIFVFVGLIFSVLSGILLSNLSNFLLRKSIPDSIIISELGRLILMLDGEASISNNFGAIAVKNNVIKSLEEITICFSSFLSRKIRVTDTREKALLDKEFKKIANGFQSLQMWIYCPMSDTRETLISRLKADFRNILSGNYHDLPKIDKLLSAEIPIKVFWLRQIERWFNLFLRIALPFLVLWIIEQSPIEISSDAMDYLLIGSFALSMLVLVVEADPGFGEKLTFLKNIQELLSARKNER